MVFRSVGRCVLVGPVDIVIGVVDELINGNLERKVGCAKLEVYDVDCPAISRSKIRPPGECRRSRRSLTGLL